jgi:TRAP-type transport system periplasmic protein
MTKSNSFLGGALAVTLAVAAFSNVLTSVVQAAEKNWKMHMVWVPARPEAQSYQAFVDKVNKEAGDKLNITLYSGGSLGVKDVDILRILPRGTVIQAAGLYPGYMTRDEPQLSSTLPPGVVSNPNQLKEISPELTKIYEEAYDRWGIKLLGFVAHAVRDSHILCKEPVTSLEQLRGKKVRVWEQFHVDVFRKLGISAQVIGQNDLYMAMQTGVVDCSVYPIGLAITVSLQEVAPYASYLFPYVLHPLNLITSKSAFDGLSPDLQTLLQNAAKETEEASFNSYLGGQNDDKALEAFKAGKGKLLEPFSKADQQKFADAARETWREMSSAGGGKAQQNYETLSKIIK